ncbi:putative gustatory receptor 47b, partial [Rhagoletis pomonella]|uniref:putative gustatory receptor 47b n=1 Tax=Rhagoletis pomonella TaxID=28610 RepID=UPI0017806D6E
FKWIYIILYYAGCLCFQPARSALQLTRFNIAYTHFIRIVILLGFIWSVTMKISSNEGSKAMIGHLSPVLKFVLIMECFISAIAFTVSSATMERKKYKHLQLTKSFQDLDNRMENDFPNINWNYYKTERKFTTFTICVIVYFYMIAFIYVYKLSNCSCDYATTFVLAFSHATCTAAPSCIIFLNIGMMDLQRIRYRLIQRLLKQQYTSGGDVRRQAEFQFRLARLIDYCKSYIQLILQINDVFGVVGGIDLFHDFVVLTNLTFLMCQKATEPNTRLKEYVFIFLFMLPRIYKVTIYAVYGYVTNKEQTKCIHEVKMCENYFRGSKAIKNNLDTFIHWQMQNTYSLLVGKATFCNLTILYLIVKSILSSVLILIQLQLQQNSITNRMKNHGMIKDVEFIYGKS